MITERYCASLTQHHRQYQHQQQEEAVSISQPPRQSSSGSTNKSFRTSLPFGLRECVSYMKTLHDSYYHVTKKERTIPREIRHRIYEDMLMLINECLLLIQTAMEPIIRLSSSSSSYKHDADDIASTYKMMTTRYNDENGHHLHAKFWMSRTAISIYTLLFVSLATHQLYIAVYGIFILALDLIVTVAIPWLQYIWDDPKLQYLITYWDSWFHLIVKESERILLHNQHSHWRVMALTAAKNTPTTMSVVEFYVRHKTKLVRRTFWKEMGGNRYHYGKHPTKAQETNHPLSPIGKRHAAFRKAARRKMQAVPDL